MFSFSALKLFRFRQESISNNRDYRVSQFTTADEFTSTTLRVITIGQNQYGNYTCRATNKLGQSSARVELIGKGGCKVMSLLHETSTEAAWM